MSADLLFKVCNMAVLPGWLLLVIAPRWRFSQMAVFGIIIPILSLVYASVLIKVTTAGGSFEAPDFSSIESIQALMSNKLGFVAGWVHYLAFDLFVGAWITRDAAANRVNHFLTIPALFFTFMAGPFGLIIYLVMRQIRRREAIAEPQPIVPYLAEGESPVSIEADTFEESSE